MTTPRQLRKAALALPDTTETEEGSDFIYRVAGRAFARLERDGSAVLEVSGAARDQLVAKFPFRESGSALRVNLADINGMHLNSALLHAWRSQAPADLAGRLEAARTASAGDGSHSLPKAIGGPATRALLQAGIGSLEEVSRRTEAELLALHGVGPKAVRILGEALEAQERTFRQTDLT